MVAIGDPPGEKKTLFHELGHHVEYNNSDIQGAANEFIRRRKNPDQENPKNLEGYRDDEWFFEGDFIHPYMGKFYPNGNTEVVSMGLEHFSSPTRMGKLEKDDPELYFFMLGVILNA